MSIGRKYLNDLGELKPGFQRIELSSGEYVDVSQGASNIESLVLLLILSVAVYIGWRIVIGIIYRITYVIAKGVSDANAKD